MTPQRRKTLKTKFFKALLTKTCLVSTSTFNKKEKKNVISQMK